MHDPYTVAFEIKSPFKKKSKLFPLGHRKSLITIWHRDKESDGTDDSCGWWLRPRHLDQKILAEIQSEFEFNFKNNYWFDKEGKQLFSTIGTLVDMYGKATWIIFKHNRSKRNRFMRKHLYDIMHLAENPIDCIGDAITNKYGYDKNDHEGRFGNLAGIIYADIMNEQRKWYQHPRWHFWHWRIQRRFFIFKKKSNEVLAKVDESGIQILNQ